MVLNIRVSPAVLCSDCVKLDSSPPLWLWRRAPLSLSKPLADIRELSLLRWTTEAWPLISEEFEYCSTQWLRDSQRPRPLICNVSRACGGKTAHYVNIKCFSLQTPLEEQAHEKEQQQSKKSKKMSKVKSKASPLCLPNSPRATCSTAYVFKARNNLGLF